MNRYRPPARKDIERKAKADGLPPADLLGTVEIGAVFLVKDAALTFPKSRIEGAPARSFHDCRRVIILDRSEEGRARNPKTLTVAPCSSSAYGDPDPFDFDIPEEDPSTGFTPGSVRVYVQLIQPILKSDLERKEGRMSAGAMLAIQARLALKLGIIEQDRLVGLPVSELLGRAIEEVRASTLPKPIALPRR